MRVFLYCGVVLSLLGRGFPAAGSEEPWATHWAFLPVENPAPPEIVSATASNMIDAFVDAKLAETPLQAEGVVDRRTFARRVFYQLLGRPPTYGEVEAFQGMNDLNAEERLIDRLLASPQYGERWGRHWLDVSRYSDTKGYTYAGEELNFVHAWLYRDWVVDALNADVSYAAFITRQLAADQLLQQGLCEKKDLAAMGFLTLGRRFLGVEQDIIDDRIDVVSRGLLGITASCARCHDHKYDPIPTMDYYRLHSIFKSSRKKLVPLHECEDQELEKRRRALDEEYAKLAGEAASRFLDRLDEYLMATLDITVVPKPDFSEIVSQNDLIPAQVRRWYEFLSQSDRADDTVFGIWKALENLDAGASAFPEEAKAVLQSASPRANPVIHRALTETPLSGMPEVARRYARVFQAALRKDDSSRGAEWDALRKSLRRPGVPLAIPVAHVHATEWLFHTDAKRAVNAKQAELERRINALGRSAPHAVILEDRPLPINSRVLLRGDYASQGEEASRGFFEFLSPSKGNETDGFGRLELAEAIVSRSNPLTARVLVNRLWHHHFASGLVETTSDFGLRSEAPSHPALLDYLAACLVESDGSLKYLHRLMASTTIYRRASSATRDPVDPENRLLAHYPRRRLGFEAMRDSLLQASGELDLEMGGPPGVLTGEAATRRRSIYGRIDRQFVPQSLQVFDFPNPELHSPKRVETNVPQQGLYFLNGPFVRERAKALSARLMREAPRGTRRERIRLSYGYVFQREPTADELRRSSRFLERALAKENGIEPSSAGAPLTAWQRFAQALLLSNEFVFID